MAWAVLWVCVLASLTHGLPLDSSPSPRAFVGFSFWPPEPEVEPVECAAANTLLPRGTCFRSDDCIKLGGVASGKCASGGVCCVVPVLCGGVARHNNTWFVNKDFPKATTDPASCTITIRRANAKVVQARLELEVLDLGTPRRGRCREDSFLATRASVSQPITPTLCGNNSRQHMYVDLLPGEVEVQVKLDNSHLLPRQGLPQRQWKVLITQHPQEEAAPHGCLQYYRQDSSTVHSLNYDSGLNFADHLNYDVCFTRLSRSQKSEESCKRQFSNVNMEQNSLNRMVRDSHHSHYSQAASGKRHKPNRHGSGTTTSKRRTGRSVDQPQEARSGRRSDKSVDQPETRGDKKESDSKQYSEEDRVNFGVMDVLGLVNRTVEEVRVSGGAVAEEEDQNIIPLIVWSQDNQDDPASTNTSTLKNITSVPLMAPVISSAESPSPASPVPTHAVEEQPAVEERPIPLVPILASQTNEAVITQIQHVVHQIQQEKEQQLSKEEEKRIDEEDNEETGIILTTAIQDQTETAVTELFTQTSGAADWNDLLVVGSDIPVTEADTPLPKSTPNTGPISESPRPEYPQSPVLQDSVEVTSGYISVQENAESDVTTSHPKFTMETVPPQPPNTSQTLPDDGIFSIHAATLNTRTATPDSTPNVTTPSIPLTTTSSNQTFYTQTIPLDATTTPLTTETLPAEDTTTHVPVTLPYVSLPNTQTTTKDASISPPQTTPADTRIASSDVPTTSPVTSSDLLAPSVLTSTELWALKETHSPVNLTTLEGSTEDVDEMLEKLKDQFLTEYLLNGNQPSEDPSDLYLGTLGGTKSEEDTSWVTAGMVVSGAATLPSSSQAQDLMGVSGHPIETTVMPKATTLEEEAMNILGTENFNDFSIMHDTTTDASLAAETEPVTVEDSDESTESGPTANLVSVTEPVTGFAFTTPDYFTDTSTASATTAATTTAIITTTTTTTPLAGSGDGSQDVHLTVKIEEPPEDTHSDPDFPLQDDGNKQATINLVINTVASSSSATTIHLAPSTATTAAPAIPTLPITTSTLTTTSTLITIIPTTIHNIISAFPPTTTTTTTISSSLLTTSTHTPVTTATIGFDVTSVTTTAPTTTVTTLHAALPFTTISVTPTTTTTITLGLSTAHLPGTGDSMQVELTVTDPESVQVVGDLVMADHGAPQSPAEIHQVTPPPALADDIPWLVLDGSEASVSLPPEIVVSSDIGFPGDIYEPSVVSHETAVTVAQHNAAPATSEEVTTESLGGAVQGLTEEEGSDALGEEPLSEFQIVNNESNGLTDEENSVTTSTEQDNFAASDIVEPSSSGDVTVTEAVLQGTTTSQNLMGATSSPTADVAPGGTITMPPGEASPGSLTTPAGGQEPSPTTTTTTYAPSITTTTSSSSATTHKPSTTITTTLPAMTVTKATLGAQINIHVHDAHSDVEDTDSSENTIEATIDLIANSDDYTLPQDLHAEEEEEEEEEEEDFYEAFSEIEEESEPVSEEPVCGGAYVMVRQRLVCGAQLRHSLQDHISSPDERFEDVERFSVRTLNTATRSLRFSLDYETMCPRAALPPPIPPAPTKKRVTLLQYILGWYR